MLQRESARSVILILLFSLLIRLALFLIVPITGDAVFHYNFTKFIASNLYIPSFEIEVGAGALPYFHPPLHHLLGVPLYWIDPKLPFLAPLVYGVIGLFFGYRLLTLLFGKEIAFYSLISAAILPPLLYYSAINYTDSLMFLTITGALYFYFKYSKEHLKRHFIYSIIFSAFSLLTHYHGIAVPLGIAFHSIFSRKNKTDAILSLVVPLLLSSPWYVRNYLLYGNPVFPVFDLGFYPGAQYDVPTFFDSTTRLISPIFWLNMLLEFMIGAPNSGDSYSYISQNQSVSPLLPAPFVPAALVFWLLAWGYVLLIMLYGLHSLLSKEKHLATLFIFLFLLSLFFSIQTPYPRMFFSTFPFLIAGAGFGINHLLVRFKIKALISLVIAGLLIVAVPFAYAVTYKKLFEKHLEYYSLIKEKIPKDSIILSTSPERIIFYSGILSNYFGNVKGRIPADILYSKNYPALKEYNITHICETTLLHLSPVEKEFFDSIEQEPLFIYKSNGYFGKCWKI
ncbi:MAG: glycosyltransferase family 39 protein [Candidatus Anstonellales archaeon]